MRFVDQIPVVDLILNDQYLFTSVMVLLFNIYLILYNDIVIKFDLFAYDSCMSDGNYPSNRMHEFIYTCTCNVHVMYTINIVLI